MSINIRWRDQPVLRRAGLGSLAMLASVVLIAGCTSAAPGAAPGDDEGAAEDGTLDRTLVVGIAGDPANLDPQASSNSIDNEISKNTYAQWTQYVLPSVTGGDIGVLDVSQVVGDAVDVQFSEDELVATFTIRDGLTFPSGNPVTSEDFRYSIDRTFAEGMGAAFIYRTAGVTDVSQFSEISDTQFTLTLPEPSPLLLPLFRDQSISVLDSVLLSEQATDEDPWAKEWLTQNSLGGGAYTLVSV